MEQNHRSPRNVRFGVFEADMEAGELRKHGLRLKLSEQPFQILAMLVARPGEVVSREVLRGRLWPSATFVDFVHGFNKAGWGVWFFCPRWSPRTPHRKIRGKKPLGLKRRLEFPAFLGKTVRKIQRRC